MASIDNRVVEMKFDNTAFESRLQTTIESLSRLETSLKLPNATKGFADVHAAAQKVSFNPITSGIDNLVAKFSNLSIIGVTALTNITNKAVDSGISIVKSLSLDQVLSGFREYETNMRSIQTILANTKQDKTTLADVNSALDTLNEYSDKTIYNFSQMAKNIGTFTAAGVDLNTSTQAIKGIANLAAVSGSTAEQASGGMYQLSQAIASGTLRLIDWNSVNAAGMGGEVFKTALFETGKALGTLKNVPMTQTFTEWEKAGNKFRTSLEKDWVTTEVLTTTLQGFTGELNESQLLAIGYTKEQAAGIIEMGKTAVEAATEIRTFSQLMSTSKEAVGSGFAQSFRIILGDFEQATVLFSSIGAAFSEVVKKSASSRNEILQKWSDLGGRKSIIAGLTTAASSLNMIINRLQAAFARVFSPITAITLTRLSFAFEDFMKQITPSQQTLKNITDIFQGIFAAVEIGFTVVKELAGSFKDLFKALTRSEGASGVLDFITGLAWNIVELNKILVDGGGIAKIFDAITDSIIRLAKDPLGELTRLKEIAIDVFKVLVDGAKNASSLPTGVVDFLIKIRDAISNFVDSVPFLELLVAGFNHLRDGIESVAESATPVLDALKKVGDGIAGWFEELKAKMSNAAEPGDFNKIFDALNIVIVAGVGGILAFLARNGLSMGGIFDQVKNVLREVTGLLQDMQTQVKADALLKIAYAVGILALAVLLISGVNSKDLTKSLAALGTGLAGIMATFTVLTGAKGPKGIANLALMSTALVLLSASLLVLAVAVKVLSTIEQDELIRGMVAITGLLGILIVTVKLLSGNIVGMVAAGVGLIGIAIALNILAGAVMIFGQMSWEELAKGLTAVTLGLIGIAFALKLMPWNALSKGAGLLLVATSLAILAGAVMLFASMSLEELAKGFGAVAVGLIAIGLAMSLMPLSLPITAAGLLMVSVALVIIANVMQTIAQLSWEDIAKGLVAIGGALIILAVAANAMNGALAGAAAMLVMSIALDTLSDVLTKLAGLSWAEIIKGLVALAAVFAVIGIAGTLLAPAIGPIFALAAALLLIGIGVAAFGIGINAISRGIMQLLKVVGGSIDWIIDFLDNLLVRIPAIVVLLVKALLDTLDVLLEALPVVIKQLVVILGQIIDGLIELTPKLVELVIVLIDALITIIDERAVDVLMAGYRLIINLIKGITDHVDEFVTAVVDLIVKFVDALIENSGKIIEAGMNLLRTFISGLIDNIVEIATMVAELIVAFINAVALQYTIIIQAGVDLLIQFLSGVKDNLQKVIDAVTEVVTTFITEIGNSATKIAQAGADALVDFLGGISDDIWKVGQAVGDIVTKFIDTVSRQSKRIIRAGTDAIVQFIDGLGDSATEIAVAAINTIVDFVEAIDKAIADNVDDFKAAGRSIAWNILDGMTLGLAGGVKDVVGGAIDVGKSLVGAVGGFLGINSPSKVFIGIGESIIEGLAMGLDRTGASDTSATNLAQSTADTFTRSLQSLSDSLNFSTEFNPTITPVLDLTNVRVGAREISGLISSTDGINATVSTGQAQTIAVTELNTDSIPTSQNGSNELRFEQNIYAPTQLSVSDIYRQTRNQITMAKEELSIL